MSENATTGAASSKATPSRKRLRDATSDLDGSRKTPRTSAHGVGNAGQTSPQTSQDSSKGEHGQQGAKEELIKDPELYYYSFVTIRVRLLILLNVMDLLIFNPRVGRSRITCSAFLVKI